MNINDTLQAYQPLVTKTAKTYHFFGIPVEDLTQEGYIGLIYAHRNHDPVKYPKFSTFAALQIRSHILAHIRKNAGVVNVLTTRNNSKIFFNMGKYRDANGVLSGEDMSRMMSDLGVTRGEIERVIMCNVDTIGISTTDVEGEFDDMHGDSVLMDLDSNPSDLVANAEEAQIRRTAFNRAVNTLSPMERDLLNARWLSREKTTLTELGQRHGVSCEAIRLREVKMFKKIKDHVLDDAHSRQAFSCGGSA